MLISLTLHNFKKHEYLSVDFTGGTNGVYGPNYRGKTTILNGILFAMGGTSHVPGKRLERRNSTGKFGAELTFSTAAGVFRIERNKTTANMFFEGDLIAAGITAVNDKVEEVIGQSVKEWKELHYAKQKNSHSLLRYSATNLQKLLRRLVGADDVDQISVRLKNLATRQKGILDGLQGLSDEQLKDTQDRHAEVSSSRAALKDELEPRKLSITELANKITTLDAEFNTLGLSIDRLNLEQKAYLHWVQKKANLQTAVENAQGTVQQRTSALDAAKAKLAAGSKPGVTVQSLQETLRDQSVTASQLKSAIREEAELRATAGRANDELTNLSAIQPTDSTSVAADITATEAGMEVVRTSMAELKAKIATIKELVKGAACPTCGHALSDHDPEKLKAEQDTLEQQLGSEGANLTTLSGRLESYRTIVKAAEAALLKLSSAKTMAERSEALWKESSQRLTTLEKLSASHVDPQQLQDMIDNLQGLESEVRFAQREAERAQRELDDAKEQLDGLRAPSVTEDQSVKISDLTAAHEAAGVARSAPLAQLNALRTEQQLAEQRIKDLTANLVTLESILQLHETTVARLATGRARLNHIDQLQKLIKEVAEGHMVKVWANFMAHASRFANLCTGGDISALARDDEGNFTFIEDGEEMQLEEASGAQEAIIGLAVQLALASAAPCNLNVLLLDEPTADMDPDRSLATISALGALGQQIVFVSHHQTDNVVCTNAITL